MSHECARTVIGCPTAVSGVDVHAQFVGSIGAGGDGGSKCQSRQDNVLFHNVARYLVSVTIYSSPSGVVKAIRLPSALALGN